MNIITDKCNVQHIRHQIILKKIIFFLAIKVQKSKNNDKHFYSDKKYKNEREKKNKFDFKNIIIIQLNKLLFTLSFFFLSFYF